MRGESVDLREMLSVSYFPQKQARQAQPVAPCACRERTQLPLVTFFDRLYKAEPSMYKAEPSISSDELAAES